VIVNKCYFRVIDTHFRDNYQYPAGTGLFRTGNGKATSLKGFGHQTNIFQKVYQYLLSVHAQMVFKFLACLVQFSLFKRKLKIKFLPASLITLTVLKAGQNFCTGFSLLSLVDFLQLVYIDRRLQKQFFKDHRRLSESQKSSRLLEGF
jgi:hypothetical protein